MITENTHFSTLFNKYRLQAEIDSLTKLGELLAEKNIMYDESILSKWKRGERIPRDRNVLFALITIFIEKNALRTLEEANNFLYSADVRELTETEAENFKHMLHTSNPFFVPNEISPCVVREKYLKDICWKLLNNSSVVLYGMPGGGKTSIAISVAHTMRQNFPEGVYWLDCSRKSLMDILDIVASTFQTSTSRMTSLSAKALFIKKLLRNHKKFFIFDDLKEISEFISLFPQEETSQSVFLLTTRIAIQKNNYCNIRIAQFSFQESFQLSELILGKPFITVNHKKFLSFFHMIGNSPLAISILTKRLQKEPLKLDLFLSQLTHGDFSLYRKSTSISHSLELAVNSLETSLQNFFLSLGVFSEDFSIDTVAWLQDISQKQAEERLSQLFRLSLVEKSTFNNYRLHPLIKLFVTNRFKNFYLYKKGLLFYHKLLLESESNSRIERELAEIKFLFEKCFTYGYYKEIILVWKEFQHILWNKGFWILYKKIGELAYQATLYLRDDEYRMDLCIHGLSWCCLWMGERELAEKYVREGIALATTLRSARNLADGRQRLGKLLQVQGDYAHSLKESFAALKYFKSHKLLEKVTDTLPDIAGVYWALCDEKKAMEFLEKSFAIASENKFISQQAYIFIFLGCVYLSHQEYNLAEFSFKKSIQLEIIYRKMPDILFWSNLGLGLIAQAKKEEEESIEFFQKAKIQRERLGMNTSVIFNRKFFSFFLNHFPEFLRLS